VIRRDKVISLINLAVGGDALHRRGREVVGDDIFKAPNFFRVADGPQSRSGQSFQHGNAILDKKKLLKNEV